jgi:hypothetical protein
MTRLLHLSVFDAPCITLHSLDWMTMHSEHWMSMHCALWALSCHPNIAVQSCLCSRDLSKVGAHILRHYKADMYYRATLMYIVTHSKADM